MENVKLLKTDDEVNISRTENRAFYVLYKQAVLQELKERGAIDDCRLQLCLKRLEEEPC